LGIAGFVTSLVGLLLTCGILNFISLPLSLVALMRRPRGFAAAGTIISLIGVGGWLAAGTMLWGLIAGLMGLKHEADLQQQNMMSQRVASEAISEIEKYKAEHGKIPDGIEGSKLILEKRDAWGEPLLYEEHGASYLLRSSGPDKQLNTEDDLTWDGKVKMVETDFTVESPDGIHNDGPVIIPSGDGAKTPEAPDRDFSDVPELPK
jgi:hypothetical protein